MVSINNTITLYLQRLDHLLEKYKTYKISITKTGPPHVFGGIDKFATIETFYSYNTELVIIC